MKIKGEGVYVDSVGVFHKIQGKGVLSDDVVLQSLKIEGKLEFDKISCDEMVIDGKCKGGSLTAKNFSAYGKAQIDLLKVEQSFELKGKPKLGNVEANEIIIEARSGSVDEIKCRKLKIFEGCNFDVDEIKIAIGEIKIASKVQDELSHIIIKNIDAEKVEIENCEVSTIRCKDAFIGSNCTVEKLFVAGECKVADDSTVGETIRV